MAGFDADGARAFTLRIDRNIAPYFAGRIAECAKFRDVLATVRASDDPAAQFLVFQGPPGSGKTSLARHLGRIHADQAIFVDIDLEILESSRVLIEHVRSEVHRQATGIGKVSSLAAQSGLAIVKMLDLRNLVVDAQIARQTRDACVVLYMDEAQVVDPSAGNALRKLNTSGIGMPCVALLTGLSNTKRRLSAIEGLSRIGSKAVVDLGTMSLSECAESTSMLLRDLRAFGGDLPGIAHDTARLALGWPQHLKAAQDALCQELLVADGDLGAVRFDVVRQDALRAHRLYYRTRLEGTVLERSPALVADILDAVREHRPQSLFELEDLCDARGADGERFAKALNDRGVLGFAPDADGYPYLDVAIPSFGSYIAEQARRQLATAHH